MRFTYVLFAIAIGGASSAQTVNTSLPSLAGIVGDLARGVAEAESLLPANSDPHHFNMAPSQIKTINSAVRIYAIGQGMEPWLEKLEPSLAEGTIVHLGEIEPVHPFLLEARHFGAEMESELEDEEHEDEDGHDDHAHGDIDPHMWLSPDILGVWAEVISNRLLADMPEHAEMLADNLEVFKGDLAKIDSDLAEISASFATRDIRVVATHDAFQYLEAHLGLDSGGMLSDVHDNPAGARTLSSVSRLTGEICLIVDPNERLPEGLLPQAKYAIIDPLGTAFIGQQHYTLSFFNAITQALSSCLEPKLP